MQLVTEFDPLPLGDRTEGPNLARGRGPGAVASTASGVTVAVGLAVGVVVAVVTVGAGTVRLRSGELLVDRSLRHDEELLNPFTEPVGVADE